MLDLFPEDDMTTWKLFISYPKDCQDYNIFMKRLESSTEAFKWSDVTKIGDGFVDAIDKSDALIVLSGLWDDDKELIERPYGVEEIPEPLQDVATKVVGWNTACIVDAILLSINGEDYEFLM